MPLEVVSRSLRAPKAASLCGRLRHPTRDSLHVRFAMETCDRRPGGVRGGSGRSGGVRGAWGVRGVRGTEVRAGPL